MILVAANGFDIVAATAEPSPSPSGSPSLPPYAVAITPPLSNAYTASQTLLFSNVVSATQGETQIEQVLGDGDASQEWQEFTVPVSPITYVPDPGADRGASSTLQVFVNEVEWTEVSTFYGRGPDESIFTTRVDENGVMYVRFGNGETGRRLPTGVQNVTAQMRKGLGADGNVLADAVSIILQAQPGLKSVINPLPAVGGADPESADSIQQTAPGTVITLGRAVSLRDYEVLALSYSGVAKARAVSKDFQSRRGVALTVATSAGEPLLQLADPLHNFLDDHRDPNVPLSVSDYVPVHFVFIAMIHVLNGNKQSVVQAAAETALGPNEDGTGYLGFAQLQFGQTMFQSALITVLQDVPGVDWVELLGFYESPSAAGHGFGGTATIRDAIIIGPQEIAWPTLDDSDQAGVDLKLSGGVNDLGGP
jgi:predicted phage baseplate assembly protein